MAIFWFVQNIRIATNADEEMKLVGEIDTKHELVIDKSLATMLPATTQLRPTQRLKSNSQVMHQTIWSINLTQQLIRWPFSRKYIMIKAGKLLSMEKKRLTPV